MKGEVLGVSNENKIYQLNCAGGRISCELKGTVSALLEGEGVNSVCMDAPPFRFVRSGGDACFKTKTPQARH